MRFADHLVETTVLHVVDEGSVVQGRARRREPASDEASEEPVDLVPVGHACERGELPGQADAGVGHHGHQERGLAGGEAQRAERLDSRFPRRTWAPHDPRYHAEMQMEFTAVFRPVPEGYVAFVEELPGANSQGATLGEARANLAEAVRLVLEANRALAQEDLEGPGVIREPLRLSA
jgi:predicted RNase H-like HicB family nuclease